MSAYSPWCFFEVNRHARILFTNPPYITDTYSSTERVKQAVDKVFVKFFCCICRVCGKVDLAHKKKS
jgi:hypothetical protein